MAIQGLTWKMVAVTGDPTITALKNIHGFNSGSSRQIRERDHVFKKTTCLTKLEKIINKKQGYDVKNRWVLGGMLSCVSIESIFCVLAWTRYLC
jgi:hypothetical protein